MDKKIAARQVRNGEAIFLNRISLSRTIFYVEQNGSDYVFVYNKNKKQVEYLMTKEWMESAYAKKMIEKAKFLLGQIKLTSYKHPGPFSPVDVPIFKPKILGWRPVPKVVTPEPQKWIKDSERTLTRLRFLMDRDGDNCVYCQKKVYLPVYAAEPKATVDHFIPRSKGGSNDFHNLVLSCSSCNQKKADLDPLDFMKMIWGDELQGCPYEIKTQ